MSTEEPDLGARLRAARQRLDWSRETLAFHSGVSWSAIAQVESGRRKHARPGTLSRLSEALGVSLDYLVDGAPSSPGMLGHRALIYDTDEKMVDIAGPFLSEGIERSEAVLVVLTEANIKLLREYLGADARKVELVEAPTWYRSPVAALSAYRKFLNTSLEGGAPWVRIVGEIAWTARPDEIRMWTQYESLVNLVFSAWPVTFLCLYDERSVDPAIVQDARRTHPQTINAHGNVDSPEYANPEGFVLS